MMKDIFPLLLVVEDDPVIRETLILNLEAEGYRVISAASGAEAMQRIAGRVPRLAVVDLMLPDMHGLDLCQRIKARVDLPIIILTAIGTKEVAVKALDLWADDYVRKPFSFAELAARIRRVLRRTERSVPPQLINTAVGKLELDPLQKRVRLAGREISLTPTEARLLACLAANAGRIVATAVLVERIWPDEEGDENRLWVYMRRLREKLEPDPSSPRILVTERSRGYGLKT